MSNQHREFFDLANEKISQYQRVRRIIESLPFLEFCETAEEDDINAARTMIRGGFDDSLKKLVRKYPRAIALMTQQDVMKVARENDIEYYGSKSKATLIKELEECGITKWRI